jgi:hypothetical protein
VPSQMMVFTVHKVDKKYYFEIPNKLLNKDMQVSRLSKLPLIWEEDMLMRVRKQTSSWLFGNVFKIKYNQLKSYTAVANDSFANQYLCEE